MHGFCGSGAKKTHAPPHTFFRVDRWHWWCWRPGNWDVKDFVTAKPISPLSRRRGHAQIYGGNYSMHSFISCYYSSFASCSFSPYLSFVHFLSLYTLRIPVVGWCVGKIMRRNTDARFSTRLEDGTSPKKNFFIYYEMDDEEVNTYLCANWYGGDDDGSWVLLESLWRALARRVAAAQRMRMYERFRHQGRGTCEICIVFLSNY